MITLRRKGDREYDRRWPQEAWRTLYYPEKGSGRRGSGFGSLELLTEGRLPPRGGTRLPRDDAEIITYVREGTLVYDDSLGQSGLLKAGEFQRVTVGRGIRYSEANPSPVDWVHVFQIWLRPAVLNLQPGHEQKRFAAAERRDKLCVVASPDARNESLRVHVDAVVYSAILDVGRHIIHDLAKARSAWLHVVHGSVTFADVDLGAGDAIGVRDERAIALTAAEDAEVLLVDLGPGPAGEHDPPQ